MLPQEKQLDSLQRGQILPLYPQKIWCVNQGVLQLQTHGADGTNRVLGWLQEGQFWGTRFTQLQNIEAIAFTDCLLQQHAEHQLNTLQSVLLAQTIQRLQQTEYLLAIAGLKRIEDRLITLIFLLIQDMGQPFGNYHRIRCRFTHQNLANVIGTTRVTITRLLKDFQQQGWLNFDGDRHLLIAQDFTPKQRL